jgi:hypothetical protein
MQIVLRTLGTCFDEVMALPPGGTIALIHRRLVGGCDDSVEGWGHDRTPHGGEMTCTPHTRKHAGMCHPGWYTPHMKRWHSPAPYPCCSPTEDSTIGDVAIGTAQQGAPEGSMTMDRSTSRSAIWSVPYWLRIVDWEGSAVYHTAIDKTKQKPSSFIYLLKVFL